MSTPTPSSETLTAYVLTSTYFPAGQYRCPLTGCRWTVTVPAPQVERVSASGYTEVTVSGMDPDEVRASLLRHLGEHTTTQLLPEVVGDSVDIVLAEGDGEALRRLVDDRMAGGSEERR